MAAPPPKKGEGGKDGEGGNGEKKTKVVKREKKKGVAVEKAFEATESTMVGGDAEKVRGG